MEEELDGIANLVDLPRLVFINEESMVDSSLEIIIKRGSQKICNPIDLHSVTNTLDEIELSMIFHLVTFFVST